MIPKLREVLLLDFGVACGAVSSSQAVRQMLAGHGYQTHAVSCWMLLVDDAMSAKVVNPLLMPGCFGAKADARRSSVPWLWQVINLDGSRPSVAISCKVELDSNHGNTTRYHIGKMRQGFRIPFSFDMFLVNFLQRSFSSACNPTKISEPETDAGDALHAIRSRLDRAHI